MSFSLGRACRRFGQSFRLTTRPLAHPCVPRPFPRHTPVPSHRRAQFHASSCKRNVSSKSQSDHQQKEPTEPLPLNLSDLFDASEIHAIIRGVTDEWPRPTNIPEGWSCEWELWSPFFTLFWRSPYFLRLPQIQMIVTIHHHIPGDVEPIMFSTANPGLFAFVAEDQYYMANYTATDVSLYRLGPISTEEEFISAIQSERWKEGGPIEKDPDGEALIRRLLSRDETVAQALFDEGYLNHVPDITTPEEEQEDVFQRLLSSPSSQFVVAGAQGEELEEALRDSEMIEEFEQYFKSLSELNPTPEELEKDPKLQDAMRIRAALEEMRKNEAARELEEESWQEDEEFDDDEEMMEEEEEEMEELEEVEEARDVDGKPPPSKTS